MALQACCVGSLVNASLTCLTRLHLIPIEHRGASLYTVTRRLSALKFTLWTGSLFHVVTVSIFTQLPSDQTDEAHFLLKLAHVY